MRLALALLLLAAAPAAPAGDAPKKMESDRPMTTKMKKPGMKQGDVKRSAERTAREMKPELEREGKAAEKAR